MHEPKEIDDLDGKEILKNPLQNLSKKDGILFTYLNINSIRNKLKDVNPLTADVGICRH